MNKCVDCIEGKTCQCGTYETIGDLDTARRLYIIDVEHYIEDINKMIEYWSQRPEPTILPDQPYFSRRDIDQIFAQSPKKLIVDLYAQKMNTILFIRKISNLITDV